MELNEIEYSKFVTWMNGKQGLCNFTVSQVNFAKRIFEFCEDYPSFKESLIAIGSKEKVFGNIQDFLKDNK